MSDELEFGLRGRIVDGNVVSNAEPPFSPFPDTVIDPWIVYPFMNFGSKLFGFVIKYPDSPALTWNACGAIVTYNKASAIATTTGGMHVKLGRNVLIDDIEDLGLEAMIAFRLSYGFGPALSVLAPCLGEPDLSKRWLHACVRSRHLCLPSPPPHPEKVREFLADTEAGWRLIAARTKVRH